MALAKTCEPKYIPKRIHNRHATRLRVQRKSNESSPSNGKGGAGYLSRKRSAILQTTRVTGKVNLYRSMPDIVATAALTGLFLDTRLLLNL